MRHETWSMKHEAKHMTWTWHMTWRRKHDMKQDMKHEMKHDAWSRWLMMWSMKHDMKQDINHATKASRHLNSDSCFLGPCLPSCFFPVSAFQQYQRLSTLLHDKTWKTWDVKHQACRKTWHEATWHEKRNINHDARHMTWSWHMTWKRTHDMKQDMKHVLECRCRRCSLEESTGTAKNISKQAQAMLR